MTRRYTPDPDALLSALAGRLDALEETSTRNTRDLTALGRGVADLTSQIRATLTTPGAGPGNGGAPTAPAGGDAGSQEEAAGQPDWIGARDRQSADELLGVAEDWVSRVGIHHGIRLGADCWPIHPDVVIDLLALAAEHATAYTAAGPTGVSEFLTRWLPAGRDRIAAALSECISDHGHRHQGATYDTTELDHASVPAWWALDRHIPAVHAFALPRL